MEKKSIIKKCSNCVVVVMLVISVFMGSLPINVSVSAAEYGMQNRIYAGLTHTYEADGYSVELTITDTWQGACNARLVIKNTGETTIDNWALSFNTGCEITNIWNAVVSEKAMASVDSVPSYKYTIKNAGHNKDIPVGAQIEIGFSMNIPADQASVIISSSFSMVQNTVAISEDQYTVSSFIYGDTNYNYNGYFVIRNDSDTMIEDWVLGFTTDINVIDFHTAELIERQGNQYLIKNRDYNSEIKPGEQIFIGFTAKGTYGVQVDGSVTDTYMTDVRIGVTEEPTPSITMPITPVPTVTTEPTVTITETPTEVVTPEPTVTEEVTPTEVVTPEPTVTAEVTPTEVATPEPTITEEITPTAVITPTEVIIPTDEPTPTEIITPIPTEIVTPTEQPEYTMEELYSDEDEDGLPLYIEITVETDPKDPDTDNDGIPDAIELYNGTDPLVPDQGFESDKDFDHDGLTDGDEINIYHTYAYKQDTDGDGLRDRFEIKHGLDPLNPDTDGDGVPDGEEKIRQTMELTSDDLGYEYDDICRRTGETMTLFGEDYVIPDSFGAVKSVKVDIDIAGDIEDSTYIDNVFGISVFPSTIRSRIGVPYDITVEKNYENAVITFEYDEDKLGETEEDDLCILWYDEDLQRFVVLENAVVDTESDTVSCSVDHFSIYLLASFKKFIYDLKQATIGRLIRETSGENEQHIDIRVAVDVGSDYYKNNTELVRSGFARIANAKLPEDRISLSTAFGYQVEVDNSEEDISVTDGKKYTTHSRSLGLSKAYPSMRDFLGSIQVQDQYATLMQELESMKTYFEQYSSGTKRNKVVIWVSSSFLISDYTQQRQELVNELKASGIRIYQLYTGNDIEDTMYERLKVNLKAIGGDFFKVSDEESSKAAINSITNMLSPDYPDYEVLFQFNPGQACYKMDTDKIVGVIAGIDASLNRFGPDIEIGLKEIYRNEAEGEVVVTPSDTEKSLTWRYKVESGTFTEDKNTFLTNLYKVYTVDGACDYDFFRSAVYNSFYSVDNISANKKKVILVSDEDLSQFDKAKKYKDAGIELYYIYVGKPLDDITKGLIVINIRETEGDAYFVNDAKDFSDAVSMILPKALGVIDDRDSDGDGLSDCVELTGMVMPDNSIIKTNPYDPDTDKDGMTDGYEMGTDKKALKGVIDEESGKIKYFETADRSFFISYICRSNPLNEDSDGDGFLDGKEVVINEAIIPVDPKPLDFEVIPYIDELCRLANKYEKDTQKRQKLVLDYVRAGKYNEDTFFGTGLWENTGGSVDKSFIDFVNQSNPNIKDYLYSKNINDTKYFIDPISSNLIDFTHFAATLSAYMFDTSGFKMFIGDKIAGVPYYTESNINNLAGWAGDLQSLIQTDLLIWYDEGGTSNYFSEATLNQYSEDDFKMIVLELLEDKSQSADNDTSTHISFAGYSIRNSQFGMPDQLADIDAVRFFITYIKHDQEITISQCLKKYYYERNEYGYRGCDQRYERFIDELFVLDEDSSFEMQYSDYDIEYLRGNISRADFKSKIVELFSEYVYIYTTENSPDGEKWTLYYNAPITDNVAKGSARAFAEYIVNKWGY